MKRTIIHSVWICWKDLLEFSRSKMSLVMLILMPLFMMTMVGFIFPDNSSTIEDVPIAIVDLDDGIIGDNFQANLTMFNHDPVNDTYMMDISYLNSSDEVISQIYEGNIDGGIIITENFTESIENGSRGEIIIITDQSNPQMSLQLRAALSYSFEGMGTFYAMGNLNHTYGIPFENTQALIKPYSVETQDIIDGNPNYFQFVAPGIMAMVVMMSLMTGLPHAISYEKDTGTLDGMLVAPVRRLSIILGKVMAQTTRGMVQGLMILTLAVLIFGVVIYGNILLVLLIMMLTVFSFVGLGILITSFADKEETATMVIMTFMFPMMFMSGVFFPIEQMPGFMQAISSILPLTYATSALRKVMVLGAGLNDIAGEMMFMIAFGIVFLAIAVPMFKKAMNR